MSTDNSSPGGERRDPPDYLARQWWERLGGKPVPGGDPATLAKADALRQAIMEQYQAEAAKASEDRDALEREHQQFLFEARRRGLVTTEAQSRRPRAWWGRAVDAVLGPDTALQDRRKWLGGMAAAVMLGVLVVYRIQHEEEDEFKPMVRGDAQVQKLSDAEPAKRAESIAGALRQAGTRVVVHPGRKATWLEIEVPPENLEVLGPVLRQAGITPEPGLLFVKIERP